LKKIALFLLPILTGFLLYHFLLSKPNPKIKNAQPIGEKIICFGDSITYGTGATKGMDYPSQLSKMISRPVWNKGVPDDTTASALVRLEHDVLSQPLRIVGRQAPKIENVREEWDRKTRSGYLAIIREASCIAKAADPRYHDAVMNFPHARSQSWYISTTGSST
jgi:hypothetical protein